MIFVFLRMTYFIKHNFHFVGKDRISFLNGQVVLYCVYICATFSFSTCQLMNILADFVS